jgi:hypothetical protein
MLDLFDDDGMLAVGMFMERERIATVFKNQMGDGDPEWDEVLEWVITQIYKDVTEEDDETT